DCFQRIDGTMCIMIGDVSGKGITAAIFMAMTKTMLREKLMSGCSPAQALNQANDELCAQNPENLFVTVFVAILDSDTGKICYANAGHTAPVILQDEPYFLKMDNGMALGMFEDAGLKDDTLQLNAHQGILLYTDGVTEALDKDNHFFGTQRLHDAVLHNCTETDNAMDTVNGVLNVVHDFSAGKEQFDDTAILAAYFKTLSAKKTEISLSMDVSSINTIKETVFEMLGQNPQSRKVILACDEVLANIVHYSGADQLIFGCEKKDSFFCVHFTDNGSPFDPTAEQPQDKDFDMLDMGGMGLSLIRQTAKSMTYIRKNNLNVLTLEF
ncbi:MAG: SpoIIE family protein phosphatase, partial [Spirochaetales bacterium]|nr:SpoIIE family protein phosphatase [Spirochaetales bacterium]